MITNSSTGSPDRRPDRDDGAHRRALVASTRELAGRRSRVAAILTTAMMTVYFGFILTVAYNPELLATQIQRGLSLGIALGAIVILFAWLLTFAYVSWANRVYDPALELLRERWRESDLGTGIAAGAPTAPGLTERSS